MTSCSDGNIDQDLCDFQDIQVVCCGIDMLAVQGEALDVILVPNCNPNLPPACSDFVVQFPSETITTSSNININNNNTSTSNNVRITISINGSICPGMEMKITEKGCRFTKGTSLKPPAEALFALQEHQLFLQGKNSMRYSLVDEMNRVIALAEANLYVWDVSSRIIVCDIDGTITKSNARGVLDTMVLESYAYSHDGVCEFLSRLKEIDDSLQILYLTSRPVSYAQTTRRFVQGLRQEDDYKLPQGPLLMHPGTLGTVLYSELVSKDVYLYKRDALLRQVVLTFAAAGRDSTSSLLVSGFGNALTDSVAYEMAGISRNDIYMIDKKSQISCMNKDVTTNIADRVTVNSQGSLQVCEKEEEEALKSRRDLLAQTKSDKSNKSNGSNSSKRKVRRTLHRQYTALIGSAYNGYHDESLWRDVSFKIQTSLIK